MAELPICLGGCGTELVQAADWLAMETQLNFAVVKPSEYNISFLAQNPSRELGAKNER